MGQICTNRPRRGAGGNQQWARGQRQKITKKGQGAGQTMRESKKGRASWTGRYSKKQPDRQQDREIKTEKTGTGSRTEGQ